MNIGSFVIIMGMFGFALVFIISLSSNTVETAMYRGFLAFLCFFLLGFIIKWVINFVLTDTSTTAKPNQVSGKLENNRSHINSQTNSDSKLFDEDESPVADDDYLKTSQYVRDLLKEK